MRRKDLREGMHVYLDTSWLSEPEEVVVLTTAAYETVYPKDGWGGKRSGEPSPKTMTVDGVEWTASGYVLTGKGGSVLIGRTYQTADGTTHHAANLVQLSKIIEEATPERKAEKAEQARRERKMAADSERAKKASQELGREIKPRLEAILGRQFYIPDHGHVRLNLPIADVARLVELAEVGLNTLEDA